MAKAIINEDNILKILDEIYIKACDGIPKVNSSVEDMADDYLTKHKDINKAAKSMLNHQVAKCTTSGFITGFALKLNLYDSRALLRKSPFRLQEDSPVDAIYLKILEYEGKYSVQEWNRVLREIGEKPLGCSRQSPV